MSLRFKGRCARDFTGTILIECSRAFLMEETMAYDAMAYHPARPVIAFVITALSVTAVCAPDDARRPARPVDQRVFRISQ